MVSDQVLKVEQTAKCSQEKFKASFKVKNSKLLLILSKESTSSVKSCLTGPFALLMSKHYAAKYFRTKSRKIVGMIMDLDEQGFNNCISSLEIFRIKI